MSDQKILSRDDILSAEDVKVEYVDVPEWGGVVRLRSLTAEEMTEFVDTAGKNKADSTVRVLMLCATNENNERLFTEKDLSVLKKKSLRAFMRCQTVALQMNGLTEEAEKSRKND